MAKKKSKSRGDDQQQESGGAAAAGDSSDAVSPFAVPDSWLVQLLLLVAKDHPKVDLAHLLLARRVAKWQHCVLQHLFYFCCGLMCCVVVL